ncbi:MAG: hypothetical protein ABIH17_10850 [Pseudomonadota bacterium]
MTLVARDPARLLQKGTILANRSGKHSQRSISGMVNAPKISISHLTPDIPDYYAISHLSRIWREVGLDVEVSREYADDARLCILHHDKTRLSKDTIPDAPSGVKPLNGDVLDISKRLISTLLLTPESDWAGPVIIKSDLNHYGLQDGGDDRAGIVARVQKRLARHSWRWARKLPEKHYPVLASLNDVPGWVWSDQHLVVEKFLPEYSDDGLYCVRGWIFFGDQGYAYRSLSKDPLVKATSLVRSEILDAVPAELAALREKMKFDFGKFDYVEHDGVPILLDANKTPTYPVSDGTPTPRMRLLAKGIEAFL